MKCVIVGNGSVEDASVLRESIKEEDFVICCDGGMKYIFDEGIMPSLILGDFDSAPLHILDFYERKGVKIEKYPPEKDFTDLELGIMFAVGMKPTEIVIFGATGTRLDHTYAAMNTLIRAEKNGIPAVIRDMHNAIRLVGKSIELKGNKGDTISLMPFTEKVEGVTTKGLKYELTDFDMSIGVSLGVSNEMTGDRAEISLKKGYLFVIRSKD